MKKLVMAIAVVCLVGFATSCKKECKCTVDGKDFPLVGTVDTKDLCTQFADAQSALATIAGTPKVTCEWK